MNTTSVFWLVWLRCAAAGVALFGLILVALPSVTRQGFALMIYGEPAKLDSFGMQQVQYISLAHAVLGAVMVGWGVALFCSAQLLAQGQSAAWRLITLSIAAWFVPDTSYSLIAGFWQNAVLNSAFLLMFIPALWKLRHLRRQLK